ncbi:MAG: sulfatase-like hydrolase/transferase [Spirosomataceae bacterium]
MKRYSWLIFVLLLSGQLFSQSSSQPNILFIFADDLGYMDCGFTGSKTFETPNLDVLAKKGMVFRNAYAGAGNCAPSRGCLMSGQYTPRHGIYAVGSTTRGPQEKMKVTPVRNTMSLAPSFVTMAEALQKQGYRTGLFGKWHLGYSADTQPEAQGFEVYFDSRKNNPNKKRNEPEDPKGIFSLTKAACDFMLNSKEKPFFAYLAHHAIHSTLEAKPATIERFKKKGLDPRTALYAACVYDFDASIGLIMDFLERFGFRQKHFGRFYER